MLKTPDASIIEREGGSNRDRDRDRLIDRKRESGRGCQAERHCRQRSLNSTSAANCCPRLAAVDDFSCRDREMESREGERTVRKGI